MTIAVYENRLLSPDSECLSTLSPISSGTTIETEICIIGAGAAGIALAREFASSQFQDSSHREWRAAGSSASTQELYEAQIVAKHFP